MGCKLIPLKFQMKLWSISGVCQCNYPENKISRSTLLLAAEVFELHMEELRARQDEISKRDKDIKLLEAIIQTLGAKDSHSAHG